MVAAYQTVLTMETEGYGSVHDITEEVVRAVRASGIHTGMVNVAGLGSTLAITTIEFEPGAVMDLQRALEQIAPANDSYAHNARWGDHNGYAHLRSALMGTSQTYPVRDGRPRLGTWQQVILCDFDDTPRRREVTITVTG